MAKYGDYRGHILDNFGRPIDAVTVTVYLKGTTNLAALYANRAGSQSLSNPFTCESDGSYIFYADSANQYDIVYSKNGVTFDSTDSQDVVVQIDSTNIPMLDANNTFTQNQTIQKATPLLTLDATSGNPQLLFRVGGADKAGLYYDQVTDTVKLYDYPGDVDRVSFERATGKMIGGIVPLSRVGINGSFTTASLSNLGSHLQTITHGLGTDNVKVLIMAVGNNSGNEAAWSVSVRRPDGNLINIAGKEDASTVFIPPTPASGSVAIRVTNHAPISQTIFVSYSILREA